MFTLPPNHESRRVWEDFFLLGKPPIPPTSMVGIAGPQPHQPRQPRPRKRPFRRGVLATWARLAASEATLCGPYDSFLPPHCQHLPTITNMLVVRGVLPAPQHGGWGGGMVRTRSDRPPPAPAHAPASAFSRLAASHFSLRIFQGSSKMCPQRPPSAKPCRTHARGST